MNRESRKGFYYNLLNPSIYYNMSFYFRNLINEKGFKYE